jgi:hypothetical protein
MQAERQRQPADAAACDKNRHDRAPVMDGVMTWAAKGGNCETSLPWSCRTYVRGNCTSGLPA